MPLPSRKALVERINQLEADIAPLAAAAGLGYVGGKLVPVSTLARGASAVSPVGAAALLADLAIREEQSLAYRWRAISGTWIRGNWRRVNPTRTVWTREITRRTWWTTQETQEE